MLIHWRSISTKYVGYTNSKPSRIIATASGDGPGQPKITMYYDSALGVDENHMKAARLLAAKLDWTGQWAMGGATRGCVFVLIKDGNKRCDTFKYFGKA